MPDRPTSRSGWEARAAALSSECRAFIDGRYVAARSGATFTRISPVDGKPVATIADCEAADADAAVARAPGFRGRPLAGLRTGPLAARDRQVHRLKTIWTAYT